MYSHRRSHIPLIFSILCISQALIANDQLPTNIPNVTHNGPINFVANNGSTQSFQMRGWLGVGFFIANWLFKRKQAIGFDASVSLKQTWEQARKFAQPEIPRLPYEPNIGKNMTLFDACVFYIQQGHEIPPDALKSGANEISKRAFNMISSQMQGEIVAGTWQPYRPPQVYGFVVSPETQNTLAQTAPASMQPAVVEPMATSTGNTSSTQPLGSGSVTAAIAGKTLEAVTEQATTKAVETAAQAITPENAQRVVKNNVKKVIPKIKRSIPKPWIQRIVTWAGTAITPIKKKIVTMVAPCAPFIPYVGQAVTVGVTIYSYYANTRDALSLAQYGVNYFKGASSNVDKLKSTSGGNNASSGQPEDPDKQKKDEENDDRSKSQEAQAPGKPTAVDGFEPAKNWDGKKVKHRRGWGYPDKKGNIWIPSGPQGHGGPHWDVQYPKGGYDNIVPGGGVRGRK